MRAIAIILCASLSGGAAPAHAEGGEPHFAPFEVAQSPQDGGHAIASFEIAGEAVALHAYGRKARARMLGVSKDVERARQMSAAFDRASRPAIVTFEARISF